MKIRFALALVPSLIVKRAASIGGIVMGPMLEFDVVLDDAALADSLIDYLAEAGAEFVENDPPDAPGIA